MMQKEKSNNYVALQSTFRQKSQFSFLCYQMLFDLPIHTWTSLYFLHHSCLHSLTLKLMLVGREGGMTGPACRTNVARLNQLPALLF